MQIRFLCPQHRQWLFHNPASALGHLQSATETAVYFRERQCWSEALPYQGCAYETAELLLTAAITDSVEATLAFTANAILLSQDLAKLGETTQSICTLEHAQGRLAAEMAIHSSSGATQSCLQDCIKALSLGNSHRQQQNPASFH